MTDRLTLGALILAVILGAIVRALPFIGTDFPLNDGGLFFTMTRDLQAAGYAIPATTSYNGLDIPFAYPPLAFYLAGVANDGLGVPLTDLFRVLPFTFSLAMIPAFFLVARGLLRPAEASIATVAFALLPRSWEWLIQGGGLTRSLGALLALLTIAAAIRMYRDPSPRSVLATGVGGGLTALVHPQAAVFMAVSLLVLLVGIRRSWSGARSLALAAMVGAAVLTPWLILTLTRHGPEPFLSAQTTGGGAILGLILFLKLRFTGAPFMDVLGIMGMVGFAVALAQRKWMIPAWMLLIFLVDSRGGATYAMAPLAMLVGIALAAGLRAMRLDSIVATRPSLLVRQYPGVSLASLGLLMAAVAMNQGMIVMDDSSLHEVSPDQRAAFDWLVEELPAGSAVAVVTGLDRWEADRTSEWLPALTDLRSVATFQGFEWLGADRWRSQLGSYNALQDCSRETAACVREWNGEQAAGAEYLFVTKGPLTGPLGYVDCCPALRATLRDGADILYDGPGATISIFPGN